MYLPSSPTIHKSRDWNLKVLYYKFADDGSLFSCESVHVYGNWYYIVLIALNNTKYVLCYIGFKKNLSELHRFLTPAATFSDDEETAFVVRIIRLCRENSVDYWHHNVHVMCHPLWTEILRNRSVIVSSVWMYIAFLECS
jgi:hypothetical protein